MRVLVACEFSGTFRDAFRALGNDAWSCDLLPTEKGDAHFQADALAVAEDPAYGEWDLMIAHPPCTYLTIAAEWAYTDGPYHQKVKAETLTGAKRREAREQDVWFFKSLMNVNCIPRICCENPIGILSTQYGKPTQIIQPYEFGEDASKATCLWLKNLPPLKGTRKIAPRIVDGKPRWSNQTDSGQNKLSPGETRSQDRSRTYQGIADAMAEQWGGLENVKAA